MVTRKTKSTKTKNAVSTAVKQPEHIGLVANDGYLAPYEDAIRGRHDHAVWKINQLTHDGKTRLKVLQADMTITACINFHADGCSESGRPMPRRYTL